MDYQSYLYSGTPLIRSRMPPPPSNLAVLTGDNTNKGFFFWGGGGVKENVWLFCKAAKKSGLDSTWFRGCFLITSIIFSRKGWQWRKRWRQFKVIIAVIFLYFSDLTINIWTLLNATARIIIIITIYIALFNFPFTALYNNEVNVEPKN